MHLPNWILNRIPIYKPEVADKIIIAKNLTNFKTIPAENILGIRYTLVLVDGEIKFAVLGDKKKKSGEVRDWRSCSTKRPGKF